MKNEGGVFKWAVFTVWFRIVYNMIAQHGKLI